MNYDFVAHIIEKFKMFYLLNFPWYGVRNICDLLHFDLLTFFHHGLTNAFFILKNPINVSKKWMTMLE